MVTLGNGINTNEAERNIWLAWQKQPGVQAYYPTHDANGDVVGPWPDRQPLHFWQGYMPAWESRQLPRMVIYDWGEREISAFWAHQYITDPSVHNGVQVIPATWGTGHAYMARVPIVTQAQYSYQYNSCLQLAQTIYEPNECGRNVWERAYHLLSTYETVDKTTGAQKPISFDSWWTNGDVVMRPQVHSRYFPAPYNDMPWKQPAGAAYYNDAVRRVFPSVRVLQAMQTDAGYGYFLTKRHPVTGSLEYEFYPGIKDLTENHFPNPNYQTYNFDILTKQGIGAYLENRCPIRFVRAD